ncbi:hypothetical protein ACFLQJ_02345 [Calditrichota bacterium]
MISLSCYPGKMEGKWWGKWDGENGGKMGKWGQTVFSLFNSCAPYIIVSLKVVFNI